MKYSYAAVSDVGKREINEDALEVRAGRCYLACALGDGLGGQGSGDFASKLATDVSIRRMSGFLPIGRRRLDACVREANRLIRDQQEEQHCRMMTTLALLRLSGARAQLAYIGDTRIYWIRGGEIIYQSKDHSIPQMMVTCGEITYDQIRGHESRNLLTRALGYKDDVTAEHFAGRIRRGDRLLLCTDGFWEWVLEADMVACARGKTAQEWLNGMCALIAQRRDEEADNYSAIAIVAE